ncbi:MAG: hypothetical protein ACXU86_19055 [Archangium sp.]
MTGTRAGWVLLALCGGSTGARAGPWSNLREVSVMAGGGVEGYTLSLASRVEPGATYGVRVGVRPPSPLGPDIGLEAGYSGAENGLAPRSPLLTRRRVELVRHGAYAAASVSLTSWRLRPYVMGGLGFSVYNLRGTVQGFGDNTVGQVPLGVGVRTSRGTFTADARLGYDVLFDQRYATGFPVRYTGGPTPFVVSRAGRYSGTLHLGVRW